MSTQLGTKETKELVLFIVKLAEGIVKSTKDGEWGYLDAINFIPAGTSSMAAFKNANLILSEIKDLDEAEKQDLYNFIEKNTELDMDSTEEMIERSLKIAINLGQMVLGFRFI